MARVRGLPQPMQRPVRMAPPRPGRSVHHMTTQPLRVVVAGGGVAGIEALLTLHALAGDRVDLTLADAQPDFVYRPMKVAEPFARGLARRYPIADMARDAGARLVADAVDRGRPRRAHRSHRGRPGAALRRAPARDRCPVGSRIRARAHVGRPVRARPPGRAAARHRAGLRPPPGIRRPARARLAAARVRARAHDRARWHGTRRPVRRSPSSRPRSPRSRSSDRRRPRR